MLFPCSGKLLSLSFDRGNSSQATNKCSVFPPALYTCVSTYTDPQKHMLTVRTKKTHTRTHTDLLTSSVPVALLSEKQLELGDNLIDFILSFLDFTEAWRRHFNCAASPQSLNLPLISPRRHRCLRAVSGLLLIDVSACFMSFCDMTALTQCWFQSACHIPQRVTARESKKDKKKKKELVGMSLA